MIFVVFLWDGGFQWLQNDLKNVKIGVQMNWLRTKQKSAEVDIYRCRTSGNGRMSGRRTSGKARKSVKTVLEWWFRSSGELRTSGASRGVRTSVKRRSSGGSGSTRELSSGTRFWAENGDFGVKIDAISWMEDGETWGDARSTRKQANPWIKINKTSSNKQITKNWGYFCWGFSKLGKNTTKLG